MQRVVGAALLAVGLLCAVLGLAIMLVFGPDGRLTTGPHHVETDGIAVVTAPKLIGWKNLQLEILAELPANKPVFVGLGNSVDVQSYLDNVRRLEVSEFSAPWKVKTRQVSGQPQLLGAPTALEWWTKQSAGLGGASINVTLPDETVSAAVLSIGDTNLRGLSVTLAYGLKGAFFKGLGLLLGGVGLAWAGLLARRGETLWKTDDVGDERDDVEEEVVYVWVDEDGVEHEMTPEEAAQHEVVEEVVEIEPEMVAGAEATDSHVASAEGVVSRPAEAGTSTAPGDDEPARYFWIDDDGVEHEVSADELDEFEIVDEDDT